MNDQLPENLICFSHLRWDFVYQRPQHLMGRVAEEATVYYFEEPVFDHGIVPRLDRQEKTDNIWVCVPRLPHGLNEHEINSAIREMLDGLVSSFKTARYMFWYYTPMALKFTYGFNPICTVYDCMDELSAFKFAPKEIKDLEKKMFDEADVVFTGGYSLFEAKRHEHTNIHPFPSSIDKEHFLKARDYCQVPEDQLAIGGFKLGFYGVIDERFDIELIDQIAASRPEWQIILIGPVVKINPDTLPRRANIHYLGPKGYNELPLYLSGWDVALIPFLLNESTVFISPTKTPEYLSAGKPVVSTAIKDVISAYGKNQAVSIGTGAQEFVDIIDALELEKPGAEWLGKIDGLLANNSWDNSFAEMKRLILACIRDKNLILAPNQMMNENGY